MTILTNARLVLDGEVLHGTLIIEGGRIRDVQPGRSHHAAAIDLDGDLVIPGVVDVHTDNLERQVQPRTNARWPSRSAFLSIAGHSVAANMPANGPDMVCAMPSTTCGAGRLISRPIDSVRTCAVQAHSSM